MESTRRWNREPHWSASDLLVMALFVMAMFVGLLALCALVTLVA